MHCNSEFYFREVADIHTRAQNEPRRGTCKGDRDLLPQGPRMNPEGGPARGIEISCPKQDNTSMIKHQLAHLLISSLDPGWVERATKSKHLNSKHGK